MTQTDVCNLALITLGRRLINNIDDPTNDAKLCALIYPVAARRILTHHEWQEAIEYALLTYESNDENDRDDQYEYIFDVPSDALKVLEIDFDAEAERLVEGSHIFTSFYDVAQEEYTVGAVTSSTIQTSASITSDAPSSGHARVMLDSDTGHTFAYTGISDDTLTGVTPDPTGVSGLDVGDTVYVATDGMTLRYIKDIRDEVASAVVYGEHISQAIAMEMAKMLAPSFAPKMMPTVRDLAAEALISAVGLETDETYHAGDGDTWWDEIT